MQYLEITRPPRQDFASREALNILATNLSYTGENIRTVMLTSRYADEGKSFTSLSLMQTLGSLEKRVVLLDTDLRRSRLVSHYGIRFHRDKPNGLAQYLAGNCEMDEIIYQTNFPNCWMIPIGRTVESSLQLLSSSRMAPLMAALDSQFDMVLVDTAPAGMLADPLGIAKFCDGAMIVVAANRGRRKDINEVSQAIRKTGCPVLGVVLNGVEFGAYTSRKYYYSSERYSSYYKGGYAYSPEEKPKKRKFWSKE